MAVELNEVGAVFLFPQSCWRLFSPVDEVSAYRVLQKVSPKLLQLTTTTWASSMHLGRTFLRDSVQSTCALFDRINAHYPKVL